MDAPSPPFPRAWMNEDAGKPNRRLPRRDGLCQCRVRSLHRLRWRQRKRRDVDAMKAKSGKKHFRQIQGATHSTTGRKNGALLSQHEKNIKRSFQWIRWVAAQAG